MRLWNSMVLESYGMGPSNLWFVVIRRRSGFQVLPGLEKWVRNPMTLAPAFDETLPGMGSSLP